MKFAYYPGCSLHATAREYDMSTRAVCKQLDIELKEIKDWSCCGASSAHAVNHKLSFALPLRNLALAEQEEGVDAVVAPCAACYNRLKSADAAVKQDPSIAQTATGGERPYSGRLNVLSLLEAITGLTDAKLAGPVKKPLAGMKVACYYGCLMLRPSKVCAFDNPENPVSMDRIVRLMGAEPVAWGGKNECCGAGLAVPRADVVVKLTRDILTLARNAGADLIVTACPLCQGNLDMRQDDIARTGGPRFDMPILYFTQLMGLAYSLSADALGLKRLLVSPDRVLAGAAGGK